MQNMADIAAQFMVLAGSDRGIIKDLAPDNATLRDKLHEFCRLRDMKPITCCFFELYKTDYGRKFRIPGLFRGMVSSDWTYIYVDHTLTADRLWERSLLASTAGRGFLSRPTT